MVRTRSSVRKSRIGIALGSGSARGWAHIGILRALEEKGIVPDILCGSSVGALVGAAAATGCMNRLEAWIRELKRVDVVGYMVRSFMRAESIQSEKYLGEIFGQTLSDVRIEDLPKRFGSIATDLDTGQEVWLRKGFLLSAISPSIAFPGLLNPVHHDGRWLVDGGLVNPVPVSLCRALGADIVIGVNLNGDLLGRNRYGPVETRNGKKTGPNHDLWERLALPFRKKRGEEDSAEAEKEPEPIPPGFLEVVTGAINIMQDRITRSRMAGDPSDLTLSPHLSQVGLLDYHRSEEAIREGRACVERSLPALEDLLRRGGAWSEETSFKRFSDS
ncbi:MAG: patatin-like phospholipase family protein [Nitrospirae bacterium]|jgi:NTE family protein|nr:patatin-like phospholipase family protein [Nitrospirota bacterium]